jgi:hypothetical protein
MDLQINPNYLMQAFDFFMKYLILAFQAIVTLGVGYAVGLIVSSFVDALLSIKELEKQFVRYGAMTSKLWGSIRSFIKHYVRWFVVALILTTTGLSITYIVYSFMANLFWFIILTTIGLIVGGVVEKIVKDALDVIGLEEQLKKHRVDGALGGVALSGVIASVFKWYIVLLFIGEGAMKLQLTFISGFIRDIVSYIPGAISGFVLIIVSLILARYTSESIRARKIVFSEFIALTVEASIIFFGIVIALPLLKEDIDVSVLTDSFKILVAGVSLGLAIAVGLGLKDSFADLFRSAGGKS